MGIHNYPRMLQSRWVPKHLLTEKFGALGIHNWLNQSLWIQGSAARNARKGYNLGGKVSSQEVQKDP